MDPTSKVLGCTAPLRANITCVSHFQVTFKSLASDFCEWCCQSLSNLLRVTGELLASYSTVNDSRVTRACLLISALHDAQYYTTISYSGYPAWLL